MLMSYTSMFLESRGQPCTILRDVPVNSKVSMKRATKTTGNLAVRDAYWEGLMLASANLASGEVFDVGGIRYLAQTVETDYASSETHFFATKVNAKLTIQRYEEIVVDGNIVQQWVTVAQNVPAFGEIITAEMRRYDTGIADNARYFFQIPKSIGVRQLDRVIYNDGLYCVESVDDVMLGGVVRIQVSVDTRV